MSSLPLENKSSEAKDGTPLFLGGILILVGLMTVLFGTVKLLEAKSSERWPGVTGKVVSSEVETDRREDSHTYHGKVVYEYVVDGTSYRGDRVAIGEYGSSDESHAEGIVMQYPVGQEVTVYYDPDDPENCLLEAGVQGQAWFLPGSGLAFVVAGIVVILFKSRFRSGRMH